MKCLFEIELKQNVFGVVVGLSSQCKMSICGWMASDFIYTSQRYAVALAACYTCLSHTHAKYPFLPACVLLLMCVCVWM